jgi:hypothetical protein
MAMSEVGGLGARPLCLAVLLTRIRQRVAGTRLWTSAFAKISGQINLKFAWQGLTLDPSGTANKGCYGVDLEYDVQVDNTGTQAYPVYAYAVARYNYTAHMPVMYYFGAVVTDPDVGSGHVGVTPIAYYEGPPPSRDLAALSCTSTGAESPFSVPVGGLTTPLKFNVVNAGGAQLPVTIRLTGLGIIANGGTGG